MATTVTLVQRRITHYRVPLFERMRQLLDAEGIDLRLLHGHGTAAEMRKDDTGHLPWAQLLPTHYWLDGRMCWQPFMRQAQGSDLVILTQENKLLLNLLALVWPRQNTRLAFWGHGRNLNTPHPHGLRERFKHWTTNRVDWWFAYTELSASLVRADGFAADRITVLNNSIDTTALRQAVAVAKLSPREDLRQSLGLPPQGPIGLYLGSLYDGKRIAWLLQAAQAIQASLPGFTLAIAGDGPDRALVEAAAARHGHVRYLGSMRGECKAQLLAAADVMLNPGLLGLSILDGFVAGLPMLTTDFCRQRSPEFAYLHPGDNGLITTDDHAGFADAVVRLLRDPAELDRLRTGALHSAQAYSIEQMADRFCAGIVDCLQRGRRRAPVPAARDA